MELVPTTTEVLACDRDKDYPCLAHLLGAAIPASWPPPLLDHEALVQFVALATAGNDPFFVSYYWIQKGPQPGFQTLIGSGGACSGETPGTVIIGYSVLDEFQNRGLATEALRAMIPAIFSWRGVERITAATYPSLTASIRVLEKCGFTCAGETVGGGGIEEGTLLYILERENA
ncbi:MAG: GNAT family N-acetyltransferase [Methanomicrobiales archaeon]|nr:GNAT family N-acetyltransferase [Methanomicrobiales archaeon]